MTQQPHLAALASAVKARRERLGLAQQDLAGRGGPSVVTVGKIERGEIGKPDPSTLRKLDTALQWTAGSAADVLAGGEPRELAGESPGSAIVAAIERETALLPEARSHLINQLELLLRLTPQRIAEDAATAALDAEIKAAVEHSRDDDVEPPVTMSDRRARKGRRT